LSLRVQLEAGVHLMANFSYFALLFLIGFQWIPIATDWGSHLPDWFRVFERVFVVLGIGSLLIFYGVSCCRGREGKAPSSLPETLGALVLGAGLVLVGVRAATSGWVNTGGEFVRTPKTGSGHAVVPSVKNRGNGWWASRAKGELGLTVWLGFLVATSLVESETVAVPFLLLFGAATLYILGLLFSESYKRRQQSVSQ
jgi:hypothetical protein